MNPTTIIIILSGIITVFALVIAIVALHRANKALELSDKYEMEHLSRKMTRLYMENEGAMRIKNIVRDELARHENTRKEAQVKNTPPVAEISNTAAPEEKASEANQEQQAPQEEKVDVNPPRETVTYYTGVCKEGSFKHISSVPDSKTIFTIYAESKDSLEGVLSVDLSAYDKISQTPDYLQNACSYSGNGTRFTLIKTGSVIKENGTWVVKEPIIAEFN